MLDVKQRQRDSLDMSSVLWKCGIRVSLYDSMFSTSQAPEYYRDLSYRIGSAMPGLSNRTLPQLGPHRDVEGTENEDPRHQITMRDHRGCMIRYDLRHGTSATWR